MIVDWNGQLVDEAAAAVEVAGPPTSLSDGIYETLRAYNGVPFDLESHIRRMRDSCEKLRLSLDVGTIKWHSRIDSLLEANNLSGADVRIRIVLHRALAWEATSAVKVAILAWPVANHGLEQRRLNGLTVTCATDKRMPGASLLQMKTLNLLATVVGQQQAAEAGADDCLFLNARDEVCEGTFANVFTAVSPKHLVTPPVISPCLPGVTRMHVMRLARREGWKVDERAIPYGELVNSTEVFLTSSISELMPVICIDNLAVGNGKPGSMCQLLQRKYRELVESKTQKVSD